MIIAQRIRMRREQLHISQQELANMLETSQPQIYKYESGRNIPSGEVIVKLSRILDVSTDWLLGETDEIRPVKGNSDLSEIEREVIKIMRSKSADQQLKIVEIAKVV